MKKTFFVMFIIIFSFVFSINIYAKNQLKLFFNGKLYNLSQEIIARGNEQFINAKELTAVIGSNSKIDITNRVLSIKIGDSESNYDIRSYDYTVVDASAISHDSPEFINQTVYFPFTFTSKLYNVNIKYDKKANIIYFFPKDSKTETFINDKYRYTLTIPENLYLSVDESDSNFDVSSISLANQDNSFSASIICDSVTKTTIKNMRFLLSDYTSSDEYIFERIIEYKQSYFRSLIESYKSEFLFGNSDKLLSESNIKIIRDYSQELFGQNSNIILFNTINSNKFASVEDINLMITIPSYENETIYSLSFALKKGTLDDFNINKIMEIIRGLTIENLPKQDKIPEVLNDRLSIESANIGVYSNPAAFRREYAHLEDSSNLYGIKYPSNYIPYLQNSFIGSHSYRSFKINHNTSFSIAVEHLVGPSDKITNKINSLKSYYSSKITVRNIENETINGKDFTVFNYELENNFTREYVTDYYISNGVRLYTIKLKSLMSPPDKDVLEEFRRIVASFEFIEQQSNNKDINKSISFVKYFNEQGGYSIFYPDNWSIQDNSQDINYDLIEITNPNFSGPLSIIINQSEYTAKLTTTELVRYVTGYDSSLSKYFKNYTTPYTGKTHKLLNCSVASSGDVIAVYKLVNYLDEGDRYKMCYSIDLIRNGKINSLFISASEYLFQDGVLEDKELTYILEYMAKSFQMEEEANYTLATDNQRNKKIIYIEDSFKKVFGESSTVTFAKNLESEKDVLVYVANNSRAGAYRLYFDYNNKKIQVVSRVLNDDIEKSAKEKMKNMLKEKQIHNLSINLDDMTITVKYSEAFNASPISRTYHILVTPSKKGYTLDFVRKLDAQSVKEICKNFLDNRYLTDVTINLPRNYSYSNENKNKYFYEKRVIPIFAEFDVQSGYYYLEIDPVTDSVKMLKFISSTELKERIEEHFNLTEPTSIVINYQPAKSDNFSFNVTVISQKNNVSNEVIYMYYDGDLIFLSKDPYFSGALIQ